MLTTLLSGTIAGISNKLWLGLLSLALIVAGTLIVMAKNRDEKLVETGRDAGASRAVVRGHETTLHQAKEANDAGNQVRDDRGNAVYDECLRSATGATRQFCERLRNEPLRD